MDNEKKFDTQKKALEKLYNQMVPRKYPFIDSIDVTSVHRSDDEYEDVIVVLSVTISGEYLEDCDDIDTIQTSEDYFNRCQDNTFLMDGFLSYLVSLGKLVIIEDFIIKAMRYVWYSNGELYDDYGNQTNIV